MGVETTVKSIRLSNGIIDRIEHMAIRENRTFSNMVETILLKELQSQQKNQ